MKNKVIFSNIYNVWCVDKHGVTVWRERKPNIVVNQGLNHALSIITATAHVSGWFVGIGATDFTLAATDVATTMGITPVTHFTGTLPAYTAGAISAQSVDNSGSPAQFSITSATTLGGAYMVNSSVNAVPSAGAILFGGASFSAARAVQSGDTVNVTITIGAEVT